jgi:hypothetical protein
VQKVREVIECLFVDEVQVVGTVGVKVVAADLVPAVGEQCRGPDARVVGLLVWKADQTDATRLQEGVIGGGDYLDDVGDDESFCCCKCPAVTVVS